MADTTYTLGSQSFTYPALSYGSHAAHTTIDSRIRLRLLALYDVVDDIESYSGEVVKLLRDSRHDLLDYNVSSTMEFSALAAGLGVLGHKLHYRLLELGSAAATVHEEIVEGGPSRR